MPVERREQLYFPRDQLEKSLEKLAQYTEGEERVILSTCNRVELYSRGACVARTAARLGQFLGDYHDIPVEVFEPHLYTYQDEAALHHLFRVVSSLDSQVIGEPQITGQVKEAFATARRLHATGPIFNQLFERAFAVAKRVRTETRLGEHAVSVSSAAVGLAKKIFHDLKSKTVLVIGAGEMSALTARHFQSQGVRQLRLANRTLERAIALASSLQGQAIPWEELPAALSRADVVVSSTGARDWVIHKAEVQRAMNQRKNRPMLFIDIAVPRDVDPAVNDLDNVYLYDIDDLQHVVAENLKTRQREAVLAETIIAREVEQVRRWLDELEAIPAVIRLRRKAEAIRNHELARLFAKLDHLPEADRMAIEVMASAIVNKLLHTPIVRVKQESRSQGGTQYLQALRELFSLHADLPPPGGREIPASSHGQQGRQSMPFRLGGVLPTP